MRPFWVLIRKEVQESRWTLGLSALALFALGWLFVYVTSRNENEIIQRLGSDPGDLGGRMQMLRALGIEGIPSSAELIMASWNHPFILILISTWAIGRGSGAVAAEVERGTMDLILSRPIPRWLFLTAHVWVATAGLVILGMSLMGGAAIAVHYNILREPPGVETLFRPAINLTALGLPIYGYTLLASSMDHVRRRPASVGSVLTLAGFIIWVIALIPVFHDSWWRPWLEKLSIFKAYNPIELVKEGQTLDMNLAILGGVGAACIALAFVVFARRDLPANG
ncbi:MAG: ABC transporter permease subunit [Isosphaeraceae bacterium]